MRKPDAKTLPEYTRMLRDQWFLGCRTNIPGIVVGYAVLNKRPVCDVQLGPMQIMATGELDDLPLVERVPIGYLNMGNFTIRAPLEIGQGVWCSVSDRQLDRFLTGGGKTYVPIRGTIHDENDILAIPQLETDAGEPTAKMNPAELYIGDKTGTVTYMRLNSQTGITTVKSTAAVNVESPAVTLGQAGVPFPIARVGVDFVTVPPGGGTVPILAGPIPTGPASAHKVRG